MPKNGSRTLCAKAPTIERQRLRGRQARRAWPRAELSTHLFASNTRRNMNKQFLVFLQQCDATASAAAATAQFGGAGTAICTNCFPAETAASTYPQYCRWLSQLLAVRHYYCCCCFGVVLPKEASCCLLIQPFVIED